MQDIIPTAPRFFIAFIIGIAVSAFFGFLIGIPVLRLKGDYLAIVTLAFGEIIKNVFNAVYLGMDGTGMHFSLKDMMSLGMDLANGGFCSISVTEKPYWTWHGRRSPTAASMLQ